MPPKRSRRKFDAADERRQGRRKTGTASRSTYTTNHSTAGRNRSVRPSRTNHAGKPRKYMSDADRKRTLNRSESTGRKAEKAVRRRYERDGWNVRRVKHGADFVASKRGATRHVEVKHGTARLTPAQRKYARRVDNYVCETVDSRGRLIKRERL